MMEVKPCDTCGNQYDKAFEVQMRGRTYTFDSFECAIHALAPQCAHCESRVIGHGVEADGVIFCCGHCATREGRRGIEDRVDRSSLREGLRNIV